MSRLSKSNKYAILWLSSQGCDIKTIEKELKLSSKQIESVIDKNKNSVVESSDVKENKTVKDFMVRHSQNNVNNVSIMTQQASMISDEARRKNSISTNKNSPFYIKKT